LVAESVSSREFRAAYERVTDEQKQFEITLAIEEIEQEPAWRPGRWLGPHDSPYSGFIVDPSVDGYLIVHRIADKGATSSSGTSTSFRPRRNKRVPVGPAPVPAM
jgi:hypothetical protein